MAVIQIKRGSQEAVSNLMLAQGEMAVALDTGNVYIGTTSGNVHINPAGGTADTAVKLQTPRAFSATGDASAQPVNFDGTANVELQLVLANIASLTAGTYTKVTVDSKGRVTAGNTLVVSDLPDNIPNTKITGLGSAATANVGTQQGNVPVVQADGKLLASLLPDLSGTYVPVGTTVNGKPLTGSITLGAADVNAIPASEKGVAGGVATLGEDGVVPSSQLPSYVDDVVETYIVGSTALAEDWLSTEEGGAALTPETGKIYVVLTAGDYQNQTFRWGGTQYVEISESLALGETSSTAFPGNLGKIAYDHSQITDGNPHGTTYDEVGAAPESHVDVKASASQLGHIKAGAGLSVANDGTMTISAIDGGTF